MTLSRPLGPWDQNVHWEGNGTNWNLYKVTQKIYFIKTLKIAFISRHFLISKGERWASFESFFALEYSYYEPGIEICGLNRCGPVTNKLLICFGWWGDEVINRIWSRPDSWELSTEPHRDVHLAGISVRQKHDYYYYFHYQIWAWPGYCSVAGDVVGNQRPGLLITEPGPDRKSHLSSELIRFMFG